MARTFLLNGSNVLPSNGFLDGGEFGVHTYLLEEVRVVLWFVDELVVLDEVVRLHLQSPYKSRCGS